LARGCPGGRHNLPLVIEELQCLARRIGVFKKRIYFLFSPHVKNIYIEKKIMMGLSSLVLLHHVQG
jgi:hypothetical protein